MDAEITKALIMGATIVLGAALPAIAIGKVGTQALKSIGRNPEAANDIRTAAILIVAFAEALAIYALVIALIIKFV